jgi:hypothetical protein
VSAELTMGPILIAAEGSDGEPSAL